MSSDLFYAIIYNYSKTRPNEIFVPYRNFVAMGDKNFGLDYLPSVHPFALNNFNKSFGRNLMVSDKEPVDAR